MRQRYRAQKFIQFEKFCDWRKTILKMRERILGSLSVAYYPETIVKFKLPRHTKIQAER